MGRLAGVTLALLGLVGWASVAWVVARVDPGDLRGRGLLYLAVAAALLFSGATAGYLFSFRINALKRHQGHVGRSLAQGALPALLVPAALWLQSLRVLSLEMAAILLGLLLIGEWFLLHSQGGRVKREG